MARLNPYFTLAAQTGTMMRPIRLNLRPPAWRRIFPACLLLLASCGPSSVWPPPWMIPAEAAAAADLSSIVVLHRGIVDTLVSAASGRDCSIVYLDRGQSYCRAQEPPPLPPPYCTHSLGVVDCWANPEALVNLPPPVANGPATLTPAQEANRTQRWPPL
jgi:hypothetical protein